jgi:hypothetical protein
MFNLEVSEFFVVSYCNRCKTDHAPIRDCVDSEGSKMYFDAVVFRKNIAIVLFNGTPEETKEYLRDVQAPHDDIRVIRGENLKTYEVPDYLNY